MIKLDMHMHSGEDPYDGLRYPATALIDRAVALGFGAIAITLHDMVIEDPRVYAYARDRGLLLIPAAERAIQQLDVLLYNVSQAEIDGLNSFDDLRTFRAERGTEILTAAPHPFFPVGQSLREKVVEHLELFDALEYTQVHLSWLNFNKKAEALARQHGKPMIANSDSHNLWMFGNHYTQVDAPAEIPAIFAAIRDQRTKLISPPLSVWRCVRMFFLDPIGRRKGEQVVSFESAA